MNSVSPANPPLTAAPSLIKVPSPAVPKVNYHESATDCVDCAARVDKGAIASSCGVGGSFAEFYVAARVGKGAIACGRGAIEKDHDIIRKGGIVCRRGVGEGHQAIVGEGGIVRGRVALESHVGRGEGS